MLMHVLMVFLDGVGIGRRDARVNPMYAAPMPALRSMFGGELPSLRHRRLESANAILIPLDATLGIPGLPQSGTGQTALFTGVNGAALAGRHFGPHPYSTLKPVIKEKNIFRQLREKGKSVWFANAFPQKFFNYLGSDRARLTVTTLSCLYSGVPLLNVEDLVSGRGVSADITGAGWQSLGHAEIYPITPSEAGERLCALALEHDFVLFEYWKTDHAGHGREMQEARTVLQLLDDMLAGILRSINPNKVMLILTSDHGNLEDLTTKSHTRHPVPLIVFGNGHEEFARRFYPSEKGIADLTAVTPALVDLICNAKESTYSESLTEKEFSSLT
jgi:2,3-bisphosphoglycerate-independent phosphoglycerate mutase